MLVVNVCQCTPRHMLLGAVWSCVHYFFPFQICPGPLDFRFTTASVNPVTDKISIPILTDDIVEDAETFGLELTIPAGMNLRLGNITRATVTITDVNCK